MRATIPLPSPISRSLFLKCAHTPFALPAAVLFGATLALAQPPSPQAPTAVPHREPHHRTASAHPSRNPAKPSPAQAAPVAPPAPNWPINDRPNLASVTWDSSGLRVEAANSSLQQILNDVATATGAKVEGMGPDERVFGNYGPGLARDVISQLLHGSGYNVLLIGDQGHGVPRQIVLSTPAPGNPPANTYRPPPDNGEEVEPPEPNAEEPPPPQPIPPVVQPGLNQGAPMRTPQQIMQEMQERQRQIQEQNNPQN